MPSLMLCTCPCGGIDTEREHDSDCKIWFYETKVWIAVGTIEVDSRVPGNGDEKAALDKMQTDQIGEFLIWDPEDSGTEEHPTLYEIDAEGPHLK